MKYIKVYLDRVRPPFGTGSRYKTPAVRPRIVRLDVALPDGALVEEHAPVHIEEHHLLVGGEREDAVDRTVKQMLSSRHMNLCLFFEGTGQDGDERITNVTRLHDACENSGRQRLNLQPGPGTHFGAYLRGLVHGHDWWIAFRRARRWFETCSRHSPRGGRPPRVFLFGFSRGALIARHFASWLDKLDVKVDYLGLWDTVDATAGLDVEETPPPNVLHARHAVAENETRRLYGYVPLRAGGRTPEGVRIEELVFPGSHSDVGGLFDDNHVVADASLAWIAQGAAEAGILLSDPSILTPPPGNAEIILHDQSGEATNLWGILGEAKRKLEGIPRHFLCRGKREP